MTDAEQKIQEKNQRLLKVKSWKKRFEKLKGDKKNPLSESQFCKMNGFYVEAVNRYKNGKILPSASTFNKIESALQKAGV